MPFATIGGLTHCYEDAGSGEAVLLLHGNQNSSHYFTRLLPDLAADFRVLVPDLRGMGRSAHVATLPPSAWVDDTVALLDQLGVERAHVYGVSLGGMIAMRLAADHPERVRSLTIDAPIIAVDPSPLGGAAGRPVREPPPQVAAELQAMHGEDWREVLAHCDAFFRDPDLRSYLNPADVVATIAAPTLIIRGDIEEDVHPLMHAFELHMLLPHSWLWIAPHSRSLLTRRHPADSAGVFRSFVSEATGSGESAEPAGRAMLELLAGIDLFAELDRGTLAHLAAVGQIQTFQAGDVAMRQGAPADGLAVVLRGRFVASVTATGDSATIPVRVLERGECIGEMALLTNAPRSATVTCTEAGELLHLPQTPVRALLRRDAAVASAVAAVVSRRLAQMPAPLASDAKG